MKRTQINWRNNTSTDINNPVVARSIIENFVIPKFSAYNNLTYLRTIDDSNFVEAVFQIENNTNYFFKVGKLNNSGNSTRNSCGLLNFALSTSATEKQNYITPSYDYNSFFWGSNFFGSSLMYEITDDNNNLKTIWHLRPTWSSQNSGHYVASCTFAKSLSDEDIIIIFNYNNENPSVYFLDDENYTRYRLKFEASLFSSNDKVLRRTAYITSNDSSSQQTPAIINGINNNFLNIINSDLNAQTTYDITADYSRKLIKVGTNEDLYRQITSQWWAADPKGDETPATVDIAYDGT